MAQTHGLEEGSAVGIALASGLVSPDLPDLSTPYALDARQIADFQRDGHVTLRGVCSRDEVAAYRARIPAATLRLNRSREAGMGPEALRVLCLRSTGRSPMRQVAFLRMQRAANQLLAYDLAIADIAGALGYDDPFAFSTAFKRCMGMAPSAYRARRSSDQA